MQTIREAALSECLMQPRYVYRADGDSLIILEANTKESIDSLQGLPWH